MTGAVRRGPERRVAMARRGVLAAVVFAVILSAAPAAMAAGTLTVSNDPPEGGQIGDGTLISCGTQCSAPTTDRFCVNLPPTCVELPKRFTLTATPASGWEFAGWTGDCPTPSANVCMVSSVADLALQAHYRPASGDPSTTNSGGPTGPATGPTPAPGPASPVSTPTVAAPRASDLGKRGRRLILLVDRRLGFPATIPLRDGCRGRMDAALFAARRRVARATLSVGLTRERRVLRRGRVVRVRMPLAQCRYRGLLAVSDRRLRGVRSVRLVIRFAGNSRLRQKTREQRYDVARLVPAR